MCGIFGSYCNEVDLAVNREALETLKHRGPDQQGEFFDKNIYMGHRRLSILDLSENGRQPMLSNDIVITVNGEIYNFQELKAELQKKYIFRSNSDSEVVLHGYIEWGIEKLLERIDGMYAIVIYDRSQNEIILARDRYGIKPLYFSDHQLKFCWASELKALEKFLERDSLQIDRTALYDYLTYLYIPTPKTLYKNVYKLSPAHYLVFSTRSFSYKIHRYWELPVQEKNYSIDAASEKVRGLIEKSVKEQMISDVPLGFFLSGGIDSSTVVASASRFSKQLHTFSIGFDVAEHNETQYARQVAHLFSTEHSEKILDVQAANDYFNRFKEWYDEPFADTSALPSYLVSEFAKQKSTVVLTGDGGDELFGGYEWYFRYWNYNKKHIGLLQYLTPYLSNIRKRNKYSTLGRAINQLEYRSVKQFDLYAKLLGGLLPYEKQHYRKFWNIPPDYDDYWYFKKFYKSELTPFKRLQYMDFHTYLHDDIFTKVDRVSMSVALECRVPFMQKELVEFAFSLPENIIYYNNEKKGLLKYAFDQILPKDILYRPKRGFNIPLHHWNQQFLKDTSSQQERILSLFKTDE